jgi:hypothetical protein
MVNLPSSSGEASKVGEARSQQDQSMERRSIHQGLGTLVEVGGLPSEVGREGGWATGIPGQGLTIRTEDGNNATRQMWCVLMPCGMSFGLVLVLK